MSDEPRYGEPGYKTSYQKLNAELATLRATVERQAGALKKARRWAHFSEVDWDNHISKTGPSIEEFETDLKEIDAALSPEADPGKGANHGDRCSKCFDGVILADTEEWHSPLCNGCYSELMKNAKPPEPALCPSCDTQGCPTCCPEPAPGSSEALALAESGCTCLGFRGTHYANTCPFKIAESAPKPCKIHRLGYNAACKDCVSPAPQEDKP